MRASFWKTPEPRTDAVTAPKNVHRASEVKSLRLHGAMFVSFFLGAIVGPLLYLREGYVAMLLPVAVLIALIVFDTAIGLRSDSLASASPDPPGDPK